MNPSSNQTGYARPPSSVPEDAVATRYGNILLPVIPDVADGSSPGVLRSCVAAVIQLQTGLSPSRILLARCIRQGLGMNIQLGPSGTMLVQCTRHGLSMPMQRGKGGIKCKPVLPCESSLTSFRSSPALRVIIGDNRPV